jgi:hypothetical protein
VARPNDKYARTPPLVGRSPRVPDAEDVDDCARGCVTGGTTSRRFVGFLREDEGLTGGRLLGVDILNVCFNDEVVK